MGTARVQKPGSPKVRYLRMRSTDNSGTAEVDIRELDALTSPSVLISSSPTVSLRVALTLGLRLLVQRGHNLLVIIRDAAVDVVRRTHERARGYLLFQGARASPSASRGRR